jgi:hypothetical protein
MQQCIPLRTRHLRCPIHRPRLLISQFGRCLMKMRTLIAHFHPTSRTIRLSYSNLRCSLNRLGLQFRWVHLSTCLNPRLKQHRTHMPRKRIAWLQELRRPGFRAHSNHLQRTRLGILPWHLHLWCSDNLTECFGLLRMIICLVLSGLGLVRRYSCLSPPRMSPGTNRRWVCTTILQEFSKHCLLTHSIHHRQTGFWMQCWFLHLSLLRSLVRCFSSLRR